MTQTSCAPIRPPRLLRKLTGAWETTGPRNSICEAKASEPGVRILLPPPPPEVQPPFITRGGPRDTTQASLFLASRSFLRAAQGT